MIKKRRAYGTYSATVDVNIDVADVIAELTDDEIKMECTLRGIETGGGAAAAVETWRDFAEELRQSRDDRIHFEVMILRMLSMAGIPPLRIPAGEMA